MHFFKRVIIFIAMTFILLSIVQEGILEISAALHEVYKGNGDETATITGYTEEEKDIAILRLIVD